MAASFVRVLGTAGNEVSATTLVLTLANTVPVGDVVVVTAATDASVAVSGNPMSTTAVTDSKGNTYTRDALAGSNWTNATTGVIGAIFSAPVTTQLVSGDTITLTLTASTVAKVMEAVHLSGVVAPAINSKASTVSGAGTAASVGVAMGQVSAGSIIVGNTAVEGSSADTITLDSDTQDGSWVTLTRASSGNTGASSQTINPRYKIVDSTPSGTQSLDDTLGTSTRWGTLMAQYLPTPKAVLTEGSSATDATSYATASITPPANTLLLLAVTHGNTVAASTTPTATGNGLTWTQVATIQDTLRRTTVFRAYGAAPTTGAITIDFAGVTQHNCLWSVASFPGYYKVVQSNTGTATSTTPTVTLASGVGAGNATYSAMSENVTATPVGFLFEGIGTQRNQSTPSVTQAVEWDVAGANPAGFTSGSVTWNLVTLEMAANIQATASFSGTGSFAATGNVYQFVNQWATITQTTNTRVDTPDAASLDIVGDIDIRVRLAATDYSLASTQTIMAKWGGSRSFEFAIDGSGFPRWQWENAVGTQTTKTSSAVVPVADGVAVWLGITHDVNNGAAGNDVKFWYYTGLTPPADITTWTQLGTTRTTAGTTDIHAGTALLVLGERDANTTQELVGKIYAAQVRDGINGTLVANPNFSGDNWSIGNVASMAKADSTGKVWTLRGSAIINGSLGYEATSTFSGTGSFAATAFKTQFPTATFSGTGSFAATATLQHNVLASFAGVGEFTTVDALVTSWDPYDPPVAFVYLETAEDVWTELTALRNGDIDRGRQRELDKFKAGRCTLSFNNEDRLYDPVYEDGPLYGFLKINRRIRVDAFHDGVTRTIFFGYIDSIDNQRIQPKQNIATIQASDAFKVLNKATVNGTDFDAELPGVRINTVLDLIPIEAELRDIDTGTVDLQALVDVSSTLLSHVQTVEVTEFGALFVQGDGVIRFKDQDTLRTEPQQATFGDAEDEYHYRSISAQFDDALIRNPVSVDRVGGTKQTVENTVLSDPPPDGYGNNHYTLSGTYHDSDADALAAAEVILRQYQEPKRRITGMTVGPVEYEDGPEVYPQLLDRELTDSIIVIERPQGVGERVEQKSIIEGIKHSFSPKTWVTTWTLSPSYVPDASFSGTSSFSAVATVLPQWRSVQTATLNGSPPQNVITVTKPVDTAEGDLLIAFVHTHREGTIIKPSGWTIIRSTDFGSGNEAGFRSYYKVATASEPADYTWENTDSLNQIMHVATSRITGADTTNPINVSSQNEGSGILDATGQSVTTTVDNCLLIFGCALSPSGPSVTPPAGMTERWDLGGFEGATVTVTSAGATGDKVASHADASNAAHLIAITPR